MISPFPTWSPHRAQLLVARPTLRQDTVASAGLHVEVRDKFPEVGDPGARCRVPVFRA